MSRTVLHLGERYGRKLHSGRCLYIKLTGWLLQRQRQRQFCRVGTCSPGQRGGAEQTGQGGLSDKSPRF
ncbi:hypothetical protein [Photorhabdus luminescens]|uniref:hypothetical protein n=1 Tax=Photorhabdus luminescens TaxID=29488 RepID=UPI0020CCE245|nr:hypothetical protein [Photorhabdus luminescens]